MAVVAVIALAGSAIYIATQTSTPVTLTTTNSPTLTTLPSTSPSTTAAQNYTVTSSYTNYCSPVMTDVPPITNATTQTIAENCNFIYEINYDNTTTTTSNIFTTVTFTYIYTTTYAITTNTITDNYTYETFLIWSNNTSVQNPISNIVVITNGSVSCQVIQFDVSPASFIFIHPPYVVNNNGTFFGLTYSNSTSVSYLANASQDFYYTNGAIAGVIDMTFTLPAHGSC